MDKKELFLKFKELHEKKLYALGGWLVRNNKSFKLSDALYAIYKYTNGNLNKTSEIVEKMTYKDKTYGRTQVYNTNPKAKIDIIKDEDGELKLVNADAYIEKPLKGQHHLENPKIFRTSGVTKKDYAKKEEMLTDVGAILRNKFPNDGNFELEDKLTVLNNYAASESVKKSPLTIAKLIQLGKLKFVHLENGALKIMSVGQIENYKTMNTSKTIIVDESVLKLLKEELEMTEYKFKSMIKSFLSKLLSDPVNAKPNNLLSNYGYSRNKLLKLLVKDNIIEKEEKISDKDENGNLKKPSMKVKYKVPKNNFDKKLNRLYIKLFEKNLPKNKMNEDGEGDIAGATSSYSSGQFIQPSFPIQRRNTSKIDETDTNSVGDYTYDDSPFNDKEAMKRKNGKFGSISINNV